MRNEINKRLLQKTILEEYPVYMQMDLLNFLEKEKLIHKNSRKKKSENLLDVTEIPTVRKRLEFIFEKLNNIYRKCEEFEYLRAYRYFTIFKFNEIKDNIIDELLDDESIIKYGEDEFISFTAQKPTVKIENSKIIFKFNFYLTSKDDKDDKIKYPVLVVLDKQEKIVEIRLDSVKFKYKDKEMFYKENIDKVKAWIESILKINVETIDFQAISKYIKENKSDEVIITALKMRRNGTMAVLDSASNEFLTIPILGELKELLKENDEMFLKNEDTKGIKNILDKFIKNIEETSELPSVKILWHEKKIKIVVLEAYKDSDYSLLKLLDELKDGECMDYVTEYLIKCEKENRRQLYSD